MRRQVMSEPHRLRLLQVCVARQSQTRLVCLSSSAGKRARQVDQQLRQLVKRVARPQAQIGRDLIVATPACVHLRSGSAELGCPALDGGVDVFVGRGPNHAALGDLPLDLVEGGRYVVALVPGQQADAGQHRHVSPRRSDVLGEHALIERQGVVERGEGVRGRASEPTVPQGGGAGSGRGARARTARRVTASGVVREHRPASSQVGQFPAVLGHSGAAEFLGGHDEQRVIARHRADHAVEVAAVDGRGNDVC